MVLKININSEEYIKAFSIWEWNHPETCMDYS